MGLSAISIGGGPPKVVRWLGLTYMKASLTFSRMSSRGRYNGFLIRCYLTSIAVRLLKSIACNISCIAALIMCVESYGGPAIKLSVM